MNFNAKTLLFAALALIVCGNLAAQDVKVDYTKFPDADTYLKATTKANQTKTTRETGSAKSSLYGKTRPDHINNALNRYYPPVINQDGGSCGSAQNVYYMTSYEMNAYRNTDAAYPENQLPTHFTWLHTYSGVDKHSIMRRHGVPNVAVYGGKTYSEYFGNQDTSNPDYGFMQGYDRWYSAMFNRVLGSDILCDNNMMTEMGREQLKQYLWNHWGDEDFYAGGCSGIGVASGGNWGRIQSTPINKEIGVVGMYCVSSWGKTYDHALTICGYDDRIEFDLDSNGVFGEPGKDETGAWIICNSWGSGWCNKGFIYCPYKFSVSVGNVGSGFNTGHNTWRKGYEPKRTFKVLMDYDHRSEICISAGLATDTSATTPATIEDMPFFRYAGDGTGSWPAPAVPMLGKWKGKMRYEPIEFGYDVTDLSRSIDPSQPTKYFLHIQSKTGSVGKGNIYKFSYIDYDMEPDGMEIPAVIDTVAIQNSDKATIVAITVPGNQFYAPLNASLTNNKLTWSKPMQSSYPIHRFYIYKGGNKVAEVPEISNSYIVDDASATYYVTTAYSYKTKTFESIKSNPARNVAYTPAEADNKVLAASKSSISIPGLLENGLKQATIEFWIKPNEVNSLSQFIGEGWGSFLFCATSTGQIKCGWDNNNCVSTSTKVLKAGVWSHVAITVDGNILTVYVDGMKKGSITSNSYSGIPALKSFTIGCLNNGKSTLDAQIDEFRVWSIARTAADVYRNKSIPVACPSAQPDLVAYYPMNTFEEGGVLYLKDEASNYNGEITEATIETDATPFSGKTTSPIATFKVEKDVVYIGEPVLFRSSAMVNTTAWNWSAPGATTTSSNLANPYLIFANAGEFQVTHTVTSVDGTVTESTSTINVIAPSAPTADFAIVDTCLNEGEKFSFGNLSTGANCTYTWSMPGAETETMNSVNASTVYNQLGTFPVTLTVSNAGGTVQCTKYVTVVHSAPKVDFNIEPSTIYKGETTYLIDQSSSNPEAWTWTVTNGKHIYTINGQFSSLTPTHPGVYDIVLEATNDIGTSNQTKEASLIVINADSKNGLTFNGSESLVSTAPLFSKGAKAFTIEWWMNPSELLGALTMATENNQFTTSTGVDGKLTVTIGGKSVNSGENYIVTGSWHHYAIAYSFGAVKFYRDGVLFASPTTRIGTSTTNWGALTISAGEDHFKGQIDELRIWSKLLSLSTMKEYINAPLTDLDNLVSNAGLEAYYDFNQNGGSVLDRTSNHIDLTRQGFGPDGDAWGLSVGVFTLDLDPDSDPEVIEADGLTNVYEAVKAGTQQQFTPVKNGIRMVCDVPTQVTVYTADGLCRMNDKVEGVHYLYFEPGIYIVNGKKIIVE